MTNSPDPDRLDRIESEQAETKVDMEALKKLVESNAKAIEALGNQAAADRDMARADRENWRELASDTREQIRQLAAAIGNLYQTSQTQEREIRMQSGEIQNLADSIQALYASQNPPGN